MRPLGLGFRIRVFVSGFSVWGLGFGVNSARGGGV